MAMQAVECLAKVTQRATVSVCCYYAGDAIYLAELMQRAWGTMYPEAHPDQIFNLGGLQVRTVHGFIGQETDVSIIVTGVAQGKHKVTDWVYTKEPGNVAISRGRQGVIIIGNMDYLADEKARSLGNFVRLTAERCPILDGEKFEEMLPRCTGNALTWKSYIRERPEAILLYEKTNPNPRSIIAQCELNRQNRWI